MTDSHTGIQAYKLVNISLYLNDTYFLLTIQFRPFIIGENMADTVVKCGKNLSWDIKYGGEPKPTVTWFFGAEEILPSER